MSKTHVARAGDHVPKIAAFNGFPEISALWDHPKNAELKEKRTPCILNPGDHVFIPDDAQLEFALPTGKRHTIVIKRPKVHLRVAFKNASDAPLEGVAVGLECESAAFDLTLDGSGKFDQEIPIGSERCRAVFEDREVLLLVGHLRPIDLPGGQRDRLNNLGYDAGSDEEAPAPAAGEGGVGESGGGEDGAGEGGADDEGPGADGETTPTEAELAFRSAVEEFQCDHGIKPTGKLDDASKAKLLEIHGS